MVDDAANRAIAEEQAERLQLRDDREERTTAQEDLLRIADRAARSWHYFAANAPYLSAEKNEINLQTAGRWIEAYAERAKEAGRAPAW